MEELPLSVKPEQNVSLADMNRLLRETYEGTEWDLSLIHIYRQRWLRPRGPV